MTAEEVWAVIEGHLYADPLTRRECALTALRAYGDRRAEEMRGWCAEVVLRGGDGAPRLETAITHGPNAALAEAVLALPLAGEADHAKQLPFPPPPDDPRRDEPPNRP